MEEGMEEIGIDGIIIGLDLIHSVDSEKA